MNCAIQGNSSSNNTLRNQDKTPNPQKFVSEITQFEKENHENSLRDTSKIIQKKIPNTNFIVNGMFKPFAVRDGRLITGQQQYSGAEAAKLVIEALGV